MFISDAIKALEDSIRLNEATVKSLTEVVLSKQLTTSIKNVPTPTSEFYNQKGVSCLYGREPVASDMFNGEQASDANHTPYPVIDSFDTGKIPNVLEDRLAEKITTLSSINDTTTLVISTLIGTLKDYSNIVDRNSKKVKSKVWKTFKVGEYWPVGYGFSNNVDYCVTEKSESSLTLHTQSKYAFLKISPNTDAKYHFLKINVDHASELAIPAIFVILDSENALDGDQFEFRVEYYSELNPSDQSKWPEVIFFDSCHNSNSIPQPSESVSFGDNETNVNHSVRIGGFDYFYALAKDLPVNAKLDKLLKDSDRVFVSASELNNKSFNHFGEYRQINFDSMKCSKYVEYGIQKDESLKLYRNKDIILTAEIANADDQLAEKFIKNNTLVRGKNSIEFKALSGTSVFYGRPSSFFTPKTSPIYLSPEQYANPIEWITGNTIRQFSISEFNSKVKSSISNGITFEYEVNGVPSILGPSSIRLGHFETILGLTVQFEKSSTTLSYYNASSLTQVALGVVPNLKVLVGFVVILGVYYARYIVKSASEILHDSGLIIVSDTGYVQTLLAPKLLGNLPRVALSKLTESEVYSYWSPVVSAMINGDSTIKLSNLMVRYSLRKEEFNSECELFRTFKPFVDPDTQYFTSYSSSRGVIGPHIKKASEINGYLATVDARNSLTYRSDRPQGELLTAFRVGFTFNAYKGKVVFDTHAEYDPLAVSRTRNIVAIETPEAVSISDGDSVAYKTVTSDPSESGGVVESIENTLGERYVDNSTSYVELSKSDAIQVDSINGKYGWKVTSYHQSVG